MNQVILYGAEWCPDCKRVKSFFEEQNIEFNYIDIDANEEAIHTIEKLNKGKKVIPTVVINGQSYISPDNTKLESLLGLNAPHTVIMYGADWCPDCRKSKSFLDAQGVNYQYIDIDQNEWAIPIITEINGGKRKIPTLIINEGITLTEPDNEQLAQVLGLTEKKTDEVFDVLIIGGGAAGLTTAIYAQRDRFKSIILEKKTIGGNAFLTETIENYPGFQNISGPALMDKMAEQAKVYGAVIKTGESVKNISKQSGTFKVETNSKAYFAKAVVLATGSTYRRINIPGENELIGAGVHFCATCDGAFYRDKEIIVIGGGNSALEEGIFLAGFTRKVKLVNLGENFTASETYIEKVASLDNMEVYHHKKSLEFSRDAQGNFAGLKVEDTKTHQQEVIEADGAFIFIGQVPNTTAFKNIVELSHTGHILTTGLAQTSVEGIFAAGDCREGAIAQVAAATGEGVLASYGLKAYLK